MSAACAQCGSALPANAKRCGRCGAQAIAAGGGSYGLLDLEAAGGQTVGSLAIDVDEPKARKPAGRAPGGSSSTARAQTQAQAAAPSGVKHASGTRNAALKRPSQQHGDPVAAMPGRGMVLGDDPLAEGYGESERGSLDIEEDADPRRARQAAASRADSPPPPRELTDEEKRALEIAELADYGQPPAQIVGTMAYCVKVTLRKRELETELLSLSAQRKRTDDAAREAQAKLGEALYAKRKDPRLATLAKQIQAVAVADQAIGNVEKTGQKKKQSIEAERSQLENDIRAAEADAAPLREREGELIQRVEELKTRAKQADAKRKRLEQELEAARKKGADTTMLDRIRAERDAAHGEVQTLGIELRPLEDDVSAVRRDLAVHLRRLSALQQEQAAAATALERAQKTHRVSTGSAHGARRDALSALAQMAMDSGLAALAQSELQAVNEAIERRDRKRGEEELLRAATGSFDETAYKQGMMLLVGGVGALFLSLIAVVIF